MTNNVSGSVTKASEAFRFAVAENFELDTEFLDNITELFVKHAAPLVKKTAVPASPAAEEKVRAPRKKSAYNVYVREQMKTVDIQGVDHKQKMGAIASRWNSLTEEQKKVYADMAAGENGEPAL